jgi:hypothetical protein
VRSRSERPGRIRQEREENGSNTPDDQRPHETSG